MCVCMCVCMLICKGLHQVPSACLQGMGSKQHADREAADWLRQTRPASNTPSLLQMDNVTWCTFVTLLALSLSLSSSLSLSLHLPSPKHLLLLPYSLSALTASACL